jgi:hypothetical protein
VCDPHFSDAYASSKLVSHHQSCKNARNYLQCQGFQLPFQVEPQLLLDKQASAGGTFQVEPQLLLDKGASAGGMAQVEPQHFLIECKVDSFVLNLPKMRYILVREFKIPFIRHSFIRWNIFSHNYFSIAR